MGGPHRRSERTSQGTVALFRDSPIVFDDTQVHNHCYEAVDLDGIVRVRRITRLIVQPLISLAI